LAGDSRTEHSEPVPVLPGPNRLLKNLRKNVLGNVSDAYFCEASMRGEDKQQHHLFSYGLPEDRVPWIILCGRSGREWAKR
jgi:hypothetical protein